MNYLDTLLDGIEKNVVDQVKEAAAAALEEYPGQHAPIQATQPAGCHNIFYTHACEFHH